MALTVEDGTGLEDADSYISVEDANDYFTKFYGITSPWFKLSDEDKEPFLRRASKELDLLFGSAYRSSRLVTTQSLLLPRAEYEVNGITYTGIPLPVAQATCELALMLHSETLKSYDPRAGTESSISVGDITVSYFGPGKSERLKSVYSLMSNFILTTNTAYSMRVAKG